MRYVLIALLGAAIAGAGWFAYRMNDSDVSCDSIVPAPKVIAFGDSLVTGYGASRGEDAFSRLSILAGISIENRGVNGDTTKSALVRIEGVIAEKPDIVIVLLGGNDALQRVSASETEANLRTMLETLQAAGIRPVLVGVIGGFPSDPYAPMFDRLAKAYDVPLVPNVLSGIIGRDEYMSDTIHPNAAGYALAAERMLPALERSCASS